jgi:hypothetical protein
MLLRARVGLRLLLRRVVLGIARWGLVGAAPLLPFPPGLSRFVSLRALLRISWCLGLGIVPGDGRFILLLLWIPLLLMRRVTFPSGFWISLLVPHLLRL